LGEMRGKKDEVHDFNIVREASAAVPGVIEYSPEANRGGRVFSFHRILPHRCQYKKRRSHVQQSYSPPRHQGRTRQPRR
jgi:hypothetical protein